MTHISKNKPGKRQFSEIFSQLVRALHQCRAERDKNDFLWQFLTPTEKIMLSKRFAMILLLEAGESTYRITQILNVSPSTIGRIAKRWDRGGYSEVALKRGNRIDRLEEILYSLHTAGGIMPPKIKFRRKFSR